MRTLFLFLLLSMAVTGQANTLPHHQLNIVLHPESHSLSAQDRITLPTEAPSTLYFVLHRDLHPVSSDAEISPAGEIPVNGLQRYRVTLPAGQDSFTLNYGGEIYQLPRQDIRETRTFESTPGIIAQEGAVLTGDSGWYPQLGDGMLTFKLNVSLPQGWHAISQGGRDTTSPNEAKGGHAGWQENQPQNEIFLIAAPFTVYVQSDGGIEEQVYLRSDDAVLAQRYLEATSRYLAMYQQLIGPYPYAKFALVENFWETGYGMPSFTLLGSQVIRLPFIVDTSYPHEILHNWWGNGVYVDYAGGNWSEGLTAYLADHLLQEKMGSGAEYRRGTLQKYSDFVSAGRDFPLTHFTSRHSEQSEAVGYGKAMMLFHMLRRQLGDDTFVKTLRNFYRNNRFKRSSFTDLQRSFTQVANYDLQPFFSQWVEQTGAPQLRLVSALAKHTASGYRLDVAIEQTQSGPVYALNLPIAVTIAGQEEAYMTVIDMKERSVKFQIPFTGRPLRVDVDPEFDLFRRLDRAEIPPAFSQLFGADKLLIVLPRKATESLSAEYFSIAQAWQRQPSREITIKWDDEINSLPDEGSVWVLGWENKFLGNFSKAIKANAALTETEAKFGDGKYESMQSSVALTGHIGETPAGWFAAPDTAKLVILARKLPHYAKYSFAAFSGPELTNIAKGTWPVTDSPLGKAVKQEDGRMINVPHGKLMTRLSLSR